MTQIFSLAQIWHNLRQRYNKIRQCWLCGPVCIERERTGDKWFQIHPFYVCYIKIISLLPYARFLLMSTCYVDSSMASLSICVFNVSEVCTDKKSFLSIIFIWWFLHAVHGVVRHQAKRWHLPWYTGWREHAADVGGRVNVLAVLHLVCRALPVDMEAGNTGVGGQNIP